MTVKNMTSNNGNQVPNQFIIEDRQSSHTLTVFQSYKSTIAKVAWEGDKRIVTLDEFYWDYSRTTLKYLGQFLHETIWTSFNTKADIQAKIDSGEYILANLN